MHRTKTKIKTISLFIFLLICGNLASEEKTTFAHWSMTLNTGISFFDGDVPQKRLDIFPTSVQQSTYSISTEYNITSIWGLYGRFSHFSLKGNNKDVDFYTPLNAIDVGGSVNLLKLALPTKKFRLNPYGYLGIGYAYYTSNYKPESSDKRTVRGQAVTVPIGFTLEYNLTKALSLIAGIQYRAFNKDNLEGDARYNYKGVTNDFVGSGQIGMRFKLHTGKYPHMRNRAETNTAQMLKDSVRSIYRNILGMQKVQRDSILHLIAAMQKEVPCNNCCTCSNEKSITETDTLPTDSVADIYFDFDKIDLDLTALDVIRRVANTMNANPHLKVEIRGYCDYMGNNPYNNALSQKRAEVTAKELIRRGVPSGNIRLNGMGKLPTPQTKYRPNRRCEFIFIH